MTEKNWLYNGSNGNNDGNLMMSWGLGTQRITGQAGKDAIFGESQLFGHLGEAYGLISGLWAEPSTGFGLVFLTNGYHPGHEFQRGLKSAFYLPEEQAFEVFEHHSRQRCISESEQVSE